MGKWAGLGGRIRQAIKDAGFVTDKGDADVQRFAMHNGWIPNYVYRWIGEKNTPDRENIDRLGVALKVSPAWLLFGDEVAKEPVNPRKRVRRALACFLGATLLATSGVPVSARTMHLVDYIDEIRLIRSWRRFRYFPRQEFPRLVAA